METDLHEREVNDIGRHNGFVHTNGCYTLVITKATQIMLTNFEYNRDSNCNELCWGILGT